MYWTALNYLTYMYILENPDGHDVCPRVFRWLSLEDICALRGCLQLSRCWLIQMYIYVGSYWITTNSPSIYSVSGYRVGVVSPYLYNT